MMPPPSRILVTGANGQLGRSLQALAHTQPEALYDFASHSQLDITQAQAVTDWLDTHPTSCVINAAAYTAVDRAAQEPELALAINTQAPGALARACAQRDIRFFHVSTDYVFDGRLTHPYRESDTTAPLNTYGRSKLQGEQAVVAADPNAVIVRTSWVFSEWAPNFVCTMLRLGQRRPSLQVVADQIGGPTWAGHLARVLDTMAQRPAAKTPGGIYHFAGYPWVSWYEFAKEIFAQARAAGIIERAPELEPIDAAQWPTPEPRPANSRLDTSKLEALLGPTETEWKKGLQAMLSSLKNG